MKRFLLLALVFAGCGEQGPKGPPMTHDQAPADPEKGPQTATFGQGCFWCAEAVFQRLNGVTAVASGYTGGRTENPTYEDICEGNTGHVEVIQVTYDPAKIHYAELLEVFWRTHDPTTPNRQGNDVGEQYRSVIFTHNDWQKALAEEYRKKLDASGAFSAPIVTSVEPAKKFYKAEGYHQDYYNQNGGAPYCKMVVRPKVEKFEKVFKDKLKSRE